MLEALERAHAEKWTQTDDLLRTVAVWTNAVWRQLYASASGPNDEIPDPIVILRPGEEPPKPKWVQQMRDMSGGGD